MPVDIEYEYLDVFRPYLFQNPKSPQCPKLLWIVYAVCAIGSTYSIRNHDIAESQAT